MRRVVFILGPSAGGIGRHVRMLAAGTGGVVLGPPNAARMFGFERFEPLSARALRRLSPQIVHAHGVRAGAFAVLVARTLRPRPRIVVTVHNGAPHRQAARVGYRALEYLLAHGADVVLTVSADLESRMRSLGARRVEMAVVAAPGLPAGSASAGLPSGRPVVLAAGRLAPQKGFATLIAAAPAWRDLDPAPRLVIAGTGPLEGDLRRQAASLGVDAEFAGHRDDVDSLLASAAVFVLPSVWEGQPLVLHEALRAGAPVVASRAGGIPEMAGPSAALLVSPADVGALAGAVRSVLTDPALAARLRAAAVARAAQLPTESDAVAAALAVYDRLLQAGASGFGA